MNGAKAIVKSLEREGVTHIFGYPGATIAPLYDQLAHSEIRHILVRHEQHAGHAASGFARISGRPGVCMVTSGPGATNLITALATAYMDSVPLVAITGQVYSHLLGRDVFQEADITGSAEPFTKYSYLVKNTADLPSIIKEAFYIASTGRQGPVLIDIPVDVQLAEREFVFPDEVSIRGYDPTGAGEVKQIQQILQELKSAKAPLICAGGGIFTAKAQVAFSKFVQETNIPVVTTLMGLGVLPTDHPLNMGQVGMHGKSTANDAIGEADVLILMGARVSDRAVLLPDKVKRRTKIIHIDIDPAEIGKNLDTTFSVVGDMGEVLAQLLAMKPPRTADAWVARLTEMKKTRRNDYADRAKGVNPKAFVYEMSIALPDSYIYCADVGQNQLWSAGNIDIRERGRFLTTGGMGTMGYSIPAAIGAKIAAPERFTIAVCGDGSFQMSLMELATLVQHDIDVKIVVMVNGKLGLVREIQTEQYGDNQIAVDLSGSPDPVKIAEAYGIPAKRVRNQKETIAEIQAITQRKGPYLLAVEVDSWEPTLSTNG
ncbi:MAG: biosynthetic-type acetolactate synthase large subunit [Clostridiales Family XIII bacterium]|jgi:acetolactate synthase-1/2/3 large subunit|nr:biosynthetic-type acetolactate synthase large subunit [Clostridiales Family XIII bacterium]